MSSDAIEIIQRDICFQGFYRLERVQLRHSLFQGGMGAPISREVFVRPDATCVLPFDPARNEVVLIEQFRIGALDKNTHPWLIEPVAGLIEAGEQAEQVAYREAMEEAGLSLSALLPISLYYPSPGASDERTHLFLGRCDSSQAGGIHGLAEEGEDIRVHVWPLERALQALKSGEINNAASIIALQWLALNLDEVHQLWQ